MAATNIFNEILDRVHAVTARLAASGTLPAGIDQSRIIVEPPKDAAHGDMATNAAMVLAEEAGKKPRELAAAIAERLQADPLVDRVEVAGPGFINLTLRRAVWSDALRTAIAAGPGFGRNALGRGEKVNIEFVSANPTGPMHVGHGRGAVFGDALANLLGFAGSLVTREYYINDAGAQVDVLALAAEHGNALRSMSEGGWLPIVRDKAIAMMIAQIRSDLAALNVQHDVFFSERSLAEGNGSAVQITIGELRAKGLIYRGRLPPPKGQPLEDWEDREQTLFRATAFGDDVDRPLRKSDGSYTYFASDIAYHRSKVERGFRSMIDVWGADHGGYIKRVQAAVNAVRAITNATTAELDVKIVQLVKVLRGGEPVKMSKRAGEFVTLRDVVDEVGKDPVRFMMLFRKNDAALDFDLAKVIELPSEPAAARAFLIANAPLERLDDLGELALMRRLALYPRLIEAAAIAHEP